MAFWNRRRQGSVAASIHRPQGVVAGAQRFDLTNADDRARLAKQQQQWQSDVSVYADTVGTFKDSHRFVENCFRRIKLYAAFVREADEEVVPVWEAVRKVVPVDEQPMGEDTTDPDDYIEQEWADRAQEIVDGWAARDGGQSALTARAGQAVFLIGEFVTIQRAVLERRPTGDEKIEDVPKVWDWEVRTPQEIRESRSDAKILETIDTPDQRDGVPIVGLANPTTGGVDPPFVERIYRKHWQWSGWADSNCRAAVGKLEEIRLLDMIARASLRSRAMAGVFKVPDEMDFGASDQPGDQGGARKTVAFDREFSEAISAAITNEADAAGAAPTVVRGPSKFLDANVFGFVDIPRRYGPEERQQREAAIEDLGRTIELPQERLTGVADVNHWTAWQIDEDTYRAYIEPLAHVLTEGLTYGLLRVLLEAEGCPPELLDRLVVAADASRLVRRSDRGKVATEGIGIDALSWAAWRKANGFGDDDAPTLEEQAIRVALKSRGSPAMAAILLEQAGVLPAGTADRVIAAGTSVGQPGVVGDKPADGEQGPPAGDAPPEPDAASAAARPQQVGARLRAMDTNLRDRLLVLCDAAVNRSLERAGARLRNTRARATGDVRAAVAAHRDLPNAKLAQAVGPAVVAAVLGPDPIVDEDFADVEGRFDRWVSTAQTGALAELANLAGQRLTDQQLIALRSRQAEDRRAGWEHLLAGLVGYATWRLTAAEDEYDTTGEWEPTATVRPSLLRAALAIAGGAAIVATARGGVEQVGGGAVAGPASGPLMTEALSSVGAEPTSMVWVYGSAPRAVPFEDHLALDGLEFSSWDDPDLGGQEPGDHANCQCDYELVVPEPSAGDQPASDDTED